MSAMQTIPLYQWAPLSLWVMVRLQHFSFIATKTERNLASHTSQPYLIFQKNLLTSFCFWVIIQAEKQKQKVKNKLLGEN